MDVRDTFSRVVVELLDRLPPSDDRGVRLTPINVRDVLARESGPAGDLLKLESIFGERVENLTVEQYREAIGAIRSYIKRRVSNDGEFEKDRRRDLVVRFATVENVIRFLTDDNTLYRMARMDPVAKPEPSERDAY